MRFVQFALALLVGFLAAAQEPDTTDWRLYYPLALGNEWQYDNILDHYPYPSSQSYSSEEIVGDTLIDGARYARVRTCGQLEGEPASCNDVLELIRYDGEFATVVRRLPGGQLRPWKDFPCRLDLPFSGFEWISALCPDGFVEEWLVNGSYGEEHCLSGSCVVGTHKEFWLLTGATFFVSGLGPVLSGYKGGWQRTLVYARIDGVEYGTRIITVAREDAAPPDASALTIYPNPLHDAATLRFALAAPERLTLAVYDVRGRRLQSAALGAYGAGEGTVRFEAADLPPGAYHLRLYGDGVFAAGRGVIVLP